MNRVYKWYCRMHNTRSKAISRVIEIGLRIIFSCDIPSQVSIGANCTFAHNGLGVVLHPEAVIGDNCHIGQNVTVGGRSGITQVPVIGNNVLIGANALILGPITVGNNVKIGAGAIVVSDVPDGATVIPEKSNIVCREKKI